MQPENQGSTRSEAATERNDGNVLQQDLRDLGAGVAKLARDAAGQARAGAGEGIETAVAAARDALAPAERFVRERPVTALAIAFAAGWLLASRR